MTERQKLSLAIPGSSANLGAGFDSLALAYQLYCKMTFEVIDGKSDGPSIELVGKRVSSLPADEDNLVVEILKTHFPQSVQWLPGLKVTIDSEIPLARGLGSSAAAIVGTLWAGFYFSGKEPDRKEVFDIAAKIEGHPDNVAASVYGGLVVTGKADGESSSQGYTATSLEWPEKWSCVVVVPDYEVKTSDARAVLPSSVPMSDAVSNIQNTALFLVAVQRRDTELLRLSLKDRLHEPYRCKLIPEIESVRKALHEAPIIGVVLSGAGSSILVLCDKRHERFVVNELNSWISGTGRGFEVFSLDVDDDGLRVSYECDEARSVV